MRATRFATFLTCSITVLGATTVGQGKSIWPEFRGPTADGHANAPGLPLEWGEDKNVVWKVPIHDLGWSSPVVAEGRVWLTAATEHGEQMFVLAFDLETGDPLVDRTLFENPRLTRKDELNTFASPSPVIEPGRVYIHFGRYGTACLDTESGDTIWERRDLVYDDHEGPGSSPILFRDLLIFHSDGIDQQHVHALDKTTGETKWSNERSTDFGRMPPELRKGYNTPLVVDVDGEPRMISIGGQAAMAYDPASGKEIWKVRIPGFSHSTRPVVGDGLVFMSTGFMTATLIAVRADFEGFMGPDDVVWTYRRNVPKLPSFLLVDGRIYMVDDSGIATCLDAKTGERVWVQRLGGLHYASPIYAAGRIYFFDNDGRTVVIAPGDEYEELAVNELATGFMGSAAVAGKALVLRTETHLYRIEDTTGRPGDNRR